MSSPRLPAASHAEPSIAELQAQLERHQAALEAAERRIAHLTMVNQQLEQQVAANSAATLAQREREQRYRDLLAMAEQQRRNLELLSHVRAALANEVELAGLFRTVVEAVSSAFGYALVCLYLLEGNELVLQHQIGYSHPITRISLEHGVTGRVARSGKAVLLTDVRNDAAFLGAMSGVQSEICVPFLDGERVAGVLNVESTSDVELSDVDLALLQDVCEHLTIAVRRARIHADGRREREFSDALVNTVESLVIVLDRAGRIVRFNGACERTTGYSFEEVRGRYFWELLLPPEDLERVKAAFHQSADGQLARRLENSWLTRDGRRRLIAWSNTMLRDDAGLVEYLIGTGIDITEQRQAEHELRASEATLRSFYDNTPFLMGVFELVDDDLVYVAINDAGARRFGQSLDTIRGKALSTLLDPDQLALWVNQCRESLRTGRPVTFEYQQTFERDTRWRLATVGPILGHATGRPRFAYVVIDMTEHRQAEIALRTSASRLEALIENLQAGVLVEDQHRSIVLTNEAFCRMFQLPVSPEALVGADCTQSAEQAKHLFAEPERFVQRVDEILRDRRVVVAEDLLLADGRTYERDYVPIYLDGSYAGHLWLYRDITERKQVEAALADARDMALASSRLKSEFLATVSHEIRTPLNGVIGMTELLLQTPLSEEQAQFARTVDESAQALLTIINDILDYSKIEAGKLILDPADVALAELVSGVTNILRPRVREKGLALVIEIGTDVPPVVRADPGRLRQILLNLVGNAVKFTEHGRITIRMAVADAGPGGVTVRFSVSDTGIGIPEEARQRLFQPFTQADGSVTRRYGGTGLGLAISRSLVEAMGGAIGCESVEGQGSTFWFVLPLEVVAQPATQPLVGQRADPPAARPPALRRGHILLAEDHPVNQQLALLQLTRLGYTVDVAANGRIALERLAASDTHYHLVLMDCHMPEMDGYTCARAIRDLERTRGGHIPIIAMTASAQQSDRDASLAAGMDDFLSKPVRLDALAAILDRWLASTGDSPAPAAPSALPEVLDAIVLDELRAFDASEPGAFDGLVRAFLDESREHIGHIDTAIGASDAAGLLRAAHALRGASANMGAARLASACARLETCASDAKLAEADAVIAELKLAYELTRRQLEPEA